MTEQVSRVDAQLLVGIVREDRALEGIEEADAEVAASQSEVTCGLVQVTPMAGTPASANTVPPAMDTPEP